ASCLRSIPTSAGGKKSSERASQVIDTCCSKHPSSGWLECLLLADPAQPVWTSAVSPRASC
ncbi:hypothetical protein LEMLEM_LOCUS24654, partial [Lemmus lemmus]